MDATQFSYIHCGIHWQGLCRKEAFLSFNNKLFRLFHQFFPVDSHVPHETWRQYKIKSFISGFFFLLGSTLLFVAAVFFLSGLPGGNGHYCLDIPHSCPEGALWRGVSPADSVSRRNATKTLRGHYEWARQAKRLNATEYNNSDAVYFCCGSQFYYRDQSFSLTAVSLALFITSQLFISTSCLVRFLFWPKKRLAYHKTWIATLTHAAIAQRVKTRCRK